MGDFRITIDAVGGHGCQRHIKDGETLADDCGQPSCPDCAARRFVAEFRKNNSVNSAKLEHWPKNALGFTREDNQVGPVDDLLTGVRKGSF